MDTSLEITFASTAVERHYAALEAGGVLVSEKVTLDFDVSAIRTDSG